MDIVSKVIQNFDPSKKIDEDQAMFDAQMNIFDKQINEEDTSDRTGGVRERRGIEKKVREGYFEELQREGEIKEKERREVERKQRNTQALHQRFAEIAKENEEVKNSMKE
jgi:hypothetical protein